MGHSIGSSGKTYEKTPRQRNPQKGLVQGSNDDKRNHYSHLFSYRRMKIMKYEYRTEEFESYGRTASFGLNDMLNKYSDEGWEIFSISNIVSSADEDDGTAIFSQQFIFRRPKSEK